jgi:hypothetical protein
VIAALAPAVAAEYVDGHSYLSSDRQESRTLVGREGGSHSRTRVSRSPSHVRANEWRSYYRRRSAVGWRRLPRTRRVGCSAGRVAHIRLIGSPVTVASVTLSLLLSSLRR